MAKTKPWLGRFRSQKKKGKSKVQGNEDMLNKPKW